MLKLQKKTITVLSSLAVSLGAVLVPANMVQAAVFQLTIGGLDGSGEIGFDDESLYGFSTESVYGSELRNGYFKWSFGGTGRAEGASCDFYYDDCVEFSYSQSVGISSNQNSGQELSAFKNAEFIFNKGELVGINNYLWSQEFNEGPIESNESLELNNNSGRFNSSFSSFGFGYGITYLNTSGSQKFSTIKSWQGVPAEEVPEPNTISASLIGVGFLLKKKNRSQPKNSQKSEKI